MNTSKHVILKNSVVVKDSMLIDKDDVLTRRRKHLRNIELIRQKYRKIKYINQPWLHVSRTRIKVWKYTYVWHLESKERLRIQTAQLFNFS